MKNKLSPRLAAVASLIPRCDSFADIGTDHAYLPIYCVSNNISRQAIAGDIAQGPCQQGQRQIEKYQLQEKIKIRCGRGITILKPNEVNGISIAGLGGSTIIDILSGSPQVWNSLEFLVLQPQSGSPAVRHFLKDNGWKIVKESLVEDNKIIYQVMLAEKGLMKIADEFEATYGKLNIEAKSKEYYRLLEQDLKHARRLYSELEKAAGSKIREKKFQLQKWIEKLDEELKKMA